jgi:hypothetical protein
MSVCSDVDSINDACIPCDTPRQARHTWSNINHPTHCGRSNSSMMEPSAVVLSFVSAADIQQHASAYNDQQFNLAYPFLLFSSNCTAGCEPITVSQQSSERYNRNINSAAQHQTRGQRQGSQAPPRDFDQLVDGRWPISMGCSDRPILMGCSEVFR